MKRIIIIASLVAFSSSAVAATAVWTGNAHQVQTVTGQWGWNCEYDVYGQKFWQVFTGYCKNTIQVN